VKNLLIGGQAAIIYGAIEFSRDCDCMVLADEENLARLRDALAELGAEQVYVPPLSIEYLSRGHACHFRCHASGIEGFRVDVMSHLRGVDPFPALWERRHTVEHVSPPVEVLSLRDLVQSKKTQKDKDWLMEDRLVEADIVRHFSAPAEDQPAWWLKESRTPERLVQLAERFPEKVEEVEQRRSLLHFAVRGDLSHLAIKLEKEKEREREADRAYWKPLRAELEALRRQRRD
jgi:hypothetical protein